MMVMAKLNISAFYLILAGAAFVPAALQAETIADVSNDIRSDQELAAKLQNAAVGEKIYVQSHSGSISFAGHDIQITDFSGFFGFAADMAYVVVAEGRASTSEQNAGSGRMLLIPPFGKSASTERYDAARLIASQQVANPMPTDLKNKFTQIAKGQSRAITLGRLGRTNFNVAASGSAKSERARRSIVGGKTIKQMRFGKVGKEANFETRIIDRFASALKARDVGVVAEMLDPLSYGAGDLNSGGDAARLLMAKTIVAEQNWSVLLANHNIEQVEDGAGSYWKVAGANGAANITLRTTTDFIFISSLSKEG